MQMDQKSIDPVPYSQAGVSVDTNPGPSLQGQHAETGHRGQPRGSDHGYQGQPSIDQEIETLRREALQVLQEQAASALDDTGIEGQGHQNNGTHEDHMIGQLGQHSPPENSTIRQSGGARASLSHGPVDGQSEVRKTVSFRQEARSAKVSHLNQQATTRTESLTNGRPKSAQTRTTNMNHRPQGQISIDESRQRRTGAHMQTPPQLTGPINTSQKKVNVRGQGEDKLNPRQSMIHLVMLATKPDMLKKSRPHAISLDKLEENGMRFMGMSCHDWACNCLLPLTVTRYDIKTGTPISSAPPPPTLYNREYMVPKGFLVDRKDIQGSKHQRHSTELSRKPDTNNKDKRIHLKGADMLLKSNQDREDHNVMSRKKQIEKMKDVLSKGPISAQEPFLLSSPHWQSRSHTQRWTWNGKVKKHVWSLGDSHDGFMKTRSLVTS